MASLPDVSGKDLSKVLEKDGFTLARQTGSHRIYQKVTDEGTITVPVPMHTNKSLKKGTLLAILRKSGITKERLKFLLTLVLG